LRPTRRREGDAPARLSFEIGQGYGVAGHKIQEEKAMSRVADSIRRGLRDAVAYAEGKADESGYRVHVPAKIDVKAIRTRLDMTQQEFAGRFGFSVNTLRHWEQGSRQPEGPIFASSSARPRRSKKPCKRSNAQLPVRG
jgi:putative transcriptional regulator